MLSLFYTTIVSTFICDLSISFRQDDERTTSLVNLTTKPLLILMETSLCDNYFSAFFMQRLAVSLHMQLQWLELNLP